MTTTRELCRVLGAVLQVPGVERWAARLVRHGLLPRAREEAEHHEATILLLALLGTADPSQASQVAERLARLPRMNISISTGFWEGWMPAPDADQAFFAGTLGGLIRDILGCLIEDTSSVRVDNITVARDGADVAVFIYSCANFYRITYGAPSVAISGLRAFASISGDGVKALADSLKPDSPDRLFHTAERRPMLSLVIN